MANFYHGLNLKWGTQGIGASTFGASALIQSTDIEQKLDETTVKSQDGTDVAWVGYNPLAEATFEYVVATSASPTGNAAVTKPVSGNMITVTDSVDGANDIIGTTWICKSSVVKQMNTDAAKVTVRATRYPSISV